MIFNFFGTGIVPAVITAFILPLSIIVPVTLIVENSVEVTVTTFANELALTKVLAPSKFIEVDNKAAFTSFPTSGDWVDDVFGLYLTG